MARKSKYDLITAKDMYMAFRSLKDIAEYCSIPYRTLQYHVRKWESDRDTHRKTLLRELTENKRTHLVSLVGASLDLLERALATLKERGTPPTVGEARQVMGILAELDKIQKLDDGEPTDIISQNKPATIFELKQKLKADPFYIEDADFREVKDDKGDDPTYRTITNVEPKLSE